MTRTKPKVERWDDLPAGIQQLIDGYVLQDGSFQAVRVLFRAGVAIPTAQEIVGERAEYYGDRIARTPASPLDVESLAFLAAGARGRIIAVEATWDGDTVHDWFVRLLVLTAEPDGERDIGSITRPAAERYLAADEDGGARHRCAVAGEKAGRELAAHLGVPFHFASPDTPDDEARWQR